MDIQSYLKNIEDFQKCLLEYLDNEISESEYLNLINFFQDQIINSKIQEAKETLQLLLNIINNHHRTPNFWSKIDKFLLNFKDSLKQTLSNFEIFDIFKSNKRILLFLIKESIISFDQQIINIINDSEYWNSGYIKYFIIESKPFISDKLYDEIKEELNDKDFKNFEENRKIGENNSKICTLIRQDSIDEFVEYVSRTNLPISGTIKQSIFETNSFLLNRDVSLIEYAAFFGSIQIFQYLRFNKVEMKPSLWLFAIHGRNPELIHLIEENQIEPMYNNYKNLLEVSIKCYSNDIAAYIQNNYIDINSENNFMLINLHFKYRNYEFLPKDLNEPYILFFLCKYNYAFLLNQVLKSNNKLNINQDVI